jgi:hypothetical protein
LLRLPGVLKDIYGYYFTFYTKVQVKCLVIGFGITTKSCLWPEIYLSKKFWHISEKNISEKLSS